MVKIVPRDSGCEDIKGKIGYIDGYINDTYYTNAIVIIDNKFHITPIHNLQILPNDHS